VEGSLAIEDWEVGEESITITFEEDLGVGESATLAVAYTSEPEQGWYFRTEAMGYPKGDDYFVT